MARVKTVSAGAVGEQARAAAADQSAAPSAAVIGEANKSATVTDAAGRQITVRKLSIMERMRFLRMLGDQTNNQVFLTYAVIAATVRQVDDVPFPSIPATMAQIDAKLQLLDDHGVEAAGMALQELLPAQGDASSLVADAKN